MIFFIHKEGEGPSPSLYIRAEPLTPPLIMGHQDGGHPVVGAGGQVCEEATKDLPNVWNLWNVQN